MEKLRKDIDNKYKWDLSSIYSNDSEFYNDFDKIEELLKRLISYKNKVLNDSNTLLESLETSFEIERLQSKMFVYAYMSSDVDTSNNACHTLKGKINNLSTRISEIESFLVPELLKGNYELVKKYIDENQKLKQYEFILSDIYRYKKHTLSEKEERIISSFSNVLNKSSDIAQLLRNSDMIIGEIRDESGNKVSLTNSNYTIYLESKDRKVRKRAFKKMYEAYSNYKNTYAETLSGEIEKNITLSKLKSYENARNMILFDDNIDGTIYDNLVEVINNRMNVIYKYYNLKKQALKLGRLHLYDIYKDLIQYDKKYSFEEGKELVINALSILGDDYINNINRAFVEHWIDVYPNKGKKSGAYSWGSYDTNPHVLLNYNNTLDDVSTLAHELGHSMHSLYSKKNNEYHNANYKIFVAEVASTVNELLLCQYMIKNSKDKKEKMAILNRLMELFKGTIYRQTMFAEFEKDIYQKSESGEILTSDLLNEIYYNLNKKYFGKGVIIDEDIKYEWERIPHFYTSFYVYQYATGLSCAVQIVNNILKGEIKPYLNFLKSGGSNHPVELLKIANVDITDKKVIENAIDYFENIISEFEVLLNE